ALRSTCDTQFARIEGLGHETVAVQIEKVPWFRKAGRARLVRKDGLNRTGVYRNHKDSPRTRIRCDEDMFPIGEETGTTEIRSVFVGDRDPHGSSAGCRHLEESFLPRGNHHDSGTAPGPSVNLPEITNGFRRATSDWNLAYLAVHCEKPYEMAVR